MTLRTSSARSAAPGYGIWLLLASIIVLTGCASRPVSYRTAPSAPERVPKLRIVVAPLDMELSELTAGGLQERRDDWTQQAVANLQAGFDAEAGWKAPASLTPEQAARLQNEAEDAQALFRAITLNHIVTSVPIPGPFAVPVGGMNYNMGPLKEHATMLGDGAVLFVFVRNSYATAGRKALLAFSMIGAGLTGVAIVPAMGADVMSAALVETDGTILWFNLLVGGEDPRTPEGGRELAQEILEGLPNRTS